jgi:PleD family two-component response regulator
VLAASLACRQKSYFHTFKRFPREIKQTYDIIWGIVRALFQAFTVTKKGLLMAGERILIVEDNPLNMELARDLLEARGYIVLEATTAQDGIDLAKAEKPHLVLMDVQLPGMDGLTATGILREEGELQDVIIVALTATL